MSILVHETVVSSAELHEVPQARRPAVRPVLDVMRVRESKSATGEAASPIAGIERTAERGRDGPGTSADVEYRAVGTLYDLDHRSVAREPSRIFRGISCPVRQLGHPRLAVPPKGLGLDVQDDLIALGAGARDRRAVALEPGRERALGDQPQGVGPTLLGRPR